MKLKILELAPAAVLEELGLPFPSGAPPGAGDFTGRLRHLEESVQDLRARLARLEGKRQQRKAG